MVNQPMQLSGVNAPTGAARILVVEDCERTRGLIASELADAGYAVDSADSAETALELTLAAPGSYDLLLADVFLPGLRGPELAETLTQYSMSRRVLLVSGFPSHLLGLDALDGDGWSFLAKPFDQAELREAVEQALASPERPEGQAGH